MKLTGSWSNKALILSITTFVYLPFVTPSIDDPIWRNTHA